MLTETGKVLAVEREGVWVETLKTSTCEKCRARHGCGQRLLASSDAYTRIHLELPPEFGNIQPGDEVRLGMEESAFVVGVLIAYGVPLSTMLLSVLLLSRWTVPEFYLLLAAFGGLLLGGLIVRRFAHTLNAKNCYRAHLLSRVDQKHEAPTVHSLTKPG